jgi:hypothetical protein
MFQAQAEGRRSGKVAPGRKSRLRAVPDGPTASVPLQQPP